MAHWIENEDEKWNPCALIRASGLIAALYTSFAAPCT